MFSTFNIKSYHTLDPMQIARDFCLDRGLKFVTIITNLDLKLDFSKSIRTRNLILDESLNMNDFDTLDTYIFVSKNSRLDLF